MRKGRKGEGGRPRKRHSDEWRQSFDQSNNQRLTDRSRKITSVFSKAYVLMSKQAWCSPFACLFPWGHWVWESKEGLKEFKICCSGQKLNWILSCWQNLPSMHSNKVQFQIHENKYKPNTSMKCESCLPFRDISSTSVGIVTKIWNWYELKEGGLEAVPPAEPDEICTGSCLPGFLYEDPLASAFLAGLLHVSHWRRKERVLALSLHSDDCFCHAEAWLSVWVQSPSLLSPPPFLYD